MKKTFFVMGLVILAAFTGFTGCAGTGGKMEGTPSSVASTAGEVSFDGRWTGSTEIEGYGVIPMGYDFKSEGNTLTGTSDGQNGPIPIENGKIDGNKITFQVPINLNGMDIVVNYTGVLTGEKLRLTWPGQNGEQEVICTRQ